MASDIVGTVRVRVIADTSSYDSSMSSIEKTAQKTSSNVNKSFSGISKAGAVAFGALATIGQKAFGAITSSINGAVKRIDTLNNFPKVMQNLGISADQSSAVISDLSEKLRGLPTTLDAAAGSVQRLTSKNGDIQKSEKYFLAMNDAILAGGQSADIQQTAIEQLSQAYSKGKPDMMEWRSLMTAMPAQLKQVANAMGYVDADALGEDLRSGKVSMEEFMDTLVELDTQGGDNITSFAQQAKDATGGIQTTIENMKSAITRATGSIIEALGTQELTNSIAGVGSVIESIFTGKDIEKNSKQLVDGIFGMIQNVIDNLPNWVKNLGDVLVALLEGIIRSLPDVIKGIAEILPDLIDTISDVVVELIDVITQPEFITLLIEAAVQLFIAMVKAFPRVLPKLVGGLTTLVQNVVDLLLSPEFWQMLLDAAVQLFMSLVEAIPQILSSLGQALGLVGDLFGGVFSGIWDGIKDIFAPVVEFFSNKFGDAWNGIKDAFSSVGQFFGGIFDNIRETFQRIGTTVGEAVGGGFRGVVNGVLGALEGFINTPINLINGAIDVINNLPGVNVGKVPGIAFPRLATGGFATGSTLAMIGEAGREAVLPLDRNTEWADQLASILMNEMDGNTTTRGGVTVTQNVTANTPVDLQIINQQLGSAIRRVTA